MVSNIGSQVTVVAAQLQVFHLTHSSFDVGITGLVTVIPLIIFGLLGGSIADAVDRRRLMLITSTILTVLSALLVVQAGLAFQPAVRHLHPGGRAGWGVLGRLIGTRRDVAAAGPPRPDAGRQFTRPDQPEHGVDNRPVARRSDRRHPRLCLRVRARRGVVPRDPLRTDPAATCAARRRCATCGAEVGQWKGCDSWRLERT